MLKQMEDQAEPTAASEVRVTPEELATAVAALEARKQGSADTIAIGDAVSELSLNSTPDDILREVESQRERKSSSRNNKRRRLLALAAALIAFGTAGIVMRPHVRGHSIPSAPAIARTSLSDVRDGQQVYVDTYGLKQILDGHPAVQVQVYPNNHGIRWGLIKHEGKVYLQGYILQASEKQIKEKAVVVYNAEDSELTGRQQGFLVLDSGKEYADSKVTLPVQTFRCQDSMQTADYAKITVSDIHPDNHLWDDYEHGR